MHVYSMYYLYSYLLFIYLVLLLQLDKNMLQWDQTNNYFLPKVDKNFN